MEKLFPLNYRPLGHQTSLLIQTFHLDTPDLKPTNLAMRFAQI